MKTLLLLTGTLFTTAALAQNTAVINQTGGNRTASVVQNGSGNASVITQGKGQPGNVATITQSGSGNVATVSQGGSSTAAGGQSVSVSQSGNTETHIDQTDGQNNHIIINQAGETVSTPAPVAKPDRRGKQKAKKSAQ